MRPEDFIDDLKKCASDSGKVVDAVAHEMQQEAQIIARSIVTKMDLVPREEFDALYAVLVRTREKLEKLEKELGINSSK